LRPEVTSRLATVARPSIPASRPRKAAVIGDLWVDTCDGALFDSGNIVTLGHFMEGNQ